MNAEDKKLRALLMEMAEERFHVAAARIEALLPATVDGRSGAAMGTAKTMFSRSFIQEDEATWVPACATMIDKSVAPLVEELMRLRGVVCEQDVDSIDTAIAPFLKENTDG